jgi:Phytanoyl-CoA dioxygenase (PhyH)
MCVCVFFYNPVLVTRNTNPPKSKIMNVQTKKLKQILYPMTKDGYAESVSSFDGQEIALRLDRFGLVAVRILNEDECSRTLDAFLEESNEQQRPGATSKLSMDPLTWGSENWPNKSHFLVRRRPSIGWAPTLVRTHPKIREVFATIFGTDDLQSSIDRWGVMPGTVNIPTRQDDDNETIISLQDHPEWRQHLRLHWDMNPWACMDENQNKGQQQHRYQALVAILDSPESVGGFRCVPGSHHWYIEQWAGSNAMPSNYSMSSYRSVKIADHDPANELSQKIPIKAGDMLVFDSRLLHGTFANESSSMRLVQYVRMMPSSMARGDVFSAVNVLERHADWRKVLESYSELDDSARRLLALSPEEKKVTHIT